MYGFPEFLICGEVVKFLNYFLCAYHFGYYGQVMEVLRPYDDDEYGALVTVFRGADAFFEDIIGSLLENDIYNALLDLDERTIIDYGILSGRRAEVSAFLQCRYWPILFRLVDYMVFYLASRHIIPDLGTLTLADIYLARADNLYQIAGIGDCGYVEFCYRYVCLLFSRAGWNFEIINCLEDGNGEEYKVYGKMRESFSEEYKWGYFEISNSRSNKVIYIFWPDEIYEYEEISDIFSDFTSDSYFGIDSSNRILVEVYPDLLISMGFDNMDYSKMIFPNAALKAWYYKQKHRFIQKRIETADEQYFTV